ncbi:MAG: (Fe-S)-binding protein [Candidatus Jordarchaeum sp.]|uniref:(Fe-S)-binding protein n=1 Tax=Candidatus Jordarchaeum sp. TaxID=2823881 RepID=UPI00404B6BE6
MYCVHDYAYRITAHCPVARAGVPVNSRYFVSEGFRTQEREKQASKDSFNCSLCMACVKVCPREVPVPRVVEYLRSQAGEKELPSNIKQMVENIQKSGNIHGSDKEDWLMWTYESDESLEDLIKVPAEVGYFVGCNSAYSPSTARIPASTVKLFRGANVDFTILGPDETCCAAPLLMAGRLGEAKKLIEDNVKAFKDLKIKTLVTSCPACFRMWRDVYPKITEVPFEVLHVTQFISRLIEEGKLKPESVGDLRVVYQDPCELARGCGVIEEPRKALKSVPGLKLVEYSQCKDEAMCCGGGGLLRAYNLETAEDAAKLKIKEAEELGVDAIVTSCPACLQNLIKSKNKIKIIDIAELFQANPC